MKKIFFSFGGKNAVLILSNVKNHNFIEFHWSVYYGNMCLFVSLSPNGHAQGYAGSNLAGVISQPYPISLSQ